MIGYIAFSTSFTSQKSFKKLHSFIEVAFVSEMVIVLFTTFSVKIRIAEKLLWRW